MKRVAIKCVPETIQRGADHGMYGRKGCRTEGCQDFNDTGGQRGICKLRCNYWLWAIG